jgi:hypothetical protein
VSAGTYSPNGNLVAAAQVARGEVDPEFTGRVFGYVDPPVNAGVGRTDLTRSNPIDITEVLTHACAVDTGAITYVTVVLDPTDDTFVEVLTADDAGASDDRPFYITEFRKNVG